MKLTLQILGLGLFMMTLSSCDTYVGASGYAGARPGYSSPGYYTRPAPRHYHSGYPGNSYYGHNHKSYYYPRPGVSPAPAVGARVNTRGLPLNVNSNTGLSLF